ncbi:MAG: hypothetical protein FWE69_01900 [Clostridiales bacterium]|nr:hypothetical protein [Clostridiales bacterium]
MQTAQLAPKKPKPGDACRVVRQRLLDDGVVLLDWAEFRTEVVSNRE